MKINFVRACALTLGLTISSVAFGQYGYAPYQYGQPSAVRPHPSLQQAPVGRGTAVGYPAYQGGYQPAPQPTPAAFGGYQAAASAYGGLPYTAVSSSSEASELPAPPPPPELNAQGPEPIPMQAPSTSGQNQVYEYDYNNHYGGQAWSTTPAPSVDYHQPSVDYHHPVPHQSGPHYYAGPEQHGPAPCAAPAYGPVPLQNCFGHAALIYWQLEDSCDRRLLFDDAAPSTTRLSASDVSSDEDLGYELGFGRYFGCGRYFAAVNYWSLNPDLDSRIVTPAVAGNYRAHMRNWDRIDYTNGGGATTAYDHYDAAAAFRIQRDTDIQSVEFLVGGFGLGGAARGAVGPLSSCAPCAPGCGPLAGCGPGCGPLKGCTGPCGMLIPNPCSCLRLQWTAGIRWFRFEDVFQFASSTLADGYGAGVDDLYLDIDVKNDLIGFQLGARADYCIGKCFNLFIGGKAGVYGNDAEYRARLGSTNTYATVGAYYPVNAGQQINRRHSDTTLAGLAELDLGLGYRVTPCIGLYGGYRIIGVAGVATSVGAIPEDLANLNDNSIFCADDSLLMHGFYLGGSYNF